MRTRTRTVIMFVVILFTAVIKSYPQGTQIPKPYTAAQTYGYLEYLPTDYNVNPTRKFATIIFLHGFGETGDGSATALNRLTGAGPPMLIKNGRWPVMSPTTGLFPAENFIVVSPQNASGFFNPDMLRKFIDYIKVTYRADPDRIYITGLSAGAISIWNYLNRFNDQAAAVISIAGNGNSVAGNACFFSNVPHWAFHGDADGTVNVGSAINPINQMNMCTPKPVPLQKVTIYNGVGHNSWARTYDLTGMSNVDPTYDPFNISIYDWLLQFRRGTVPSTLPTANAGPNIALNLPTNSTNITGTGTPGSGTITSYAWTKVTGPTVTITNASSPTVSLANLVEGVYTFRLTVTNSQAETAFDNITVTVTNESTALVANAGADITATLPCTYILVSGSGGPVGTITRYAWSQVSGPNTATLANKTKATLITSNLVQGAYIFSLMVTDDQGATATDNVKLTVNAEGDQSPTANAGTDKSISLPATNINLTGSASEPEVHYLWSQVSGPYTATIANKTKPTVIISNLNQGTYTFRLRVTDDEALTGYDDVKVVVNPDPLNVAPAADAGPDLVITIQ